MTTKKKENHNPLQAGKILLAVATTESQKEIWSTTKINENASKAYIESLQLNLDGSIDFDILQKAYNTVLSRHDSLHGTFSKNGKYFLVKEKYKQEINRIDFTSNTKNKLNQFLSEETNTDFDLVEGPLTRATLIKISSNKYVFIFSAHHIICDGWSTAIVLNELSHIYNSLYHGSELELEWPIQFYEYATQLKNEPISHKEFWKSKFSKPVDHLKIPLSFDRPSFRTYESKRLDVHIDPFLVKKIKKIGAKNGCSFYTTLMAGFSVFLSKLSRSENVIFGISAAAQSSAGQENLVGHLVNLLPMYEEVKATDNLRDTLKSIKSSMMNSFENQSYTFGSLLKDIEIERDPSRIPLVNIIFNVDQQYPGQGMNFNNVDASYTTVPRHFENFELFFNMVTCGNDLMVECQFNTNLFSEDLVASWIDSYIEILTLLTVDIEITVESIILNNNCFTEKLDVKIDEKIQKSNEHIGTIDLDLKSNVIKIWEEALGFEDIPSDISFFSIGGHSILGLDIISKIELILEKNITLKDLFENPTIDQLSSLLSKQTGNERVFELKNIERVSEGSHPVTVKQMGILYLEQLNEGTTMHNLPSAFHIHQKLNLDIFSKAVNKIVFNHPSLRSNFKNENNVYTQVIHERESINLSYRAKTIKEEVLQSTLQALTTTTFDLENGELFKIEVFQLNPDHFVIFFMVHHIIWDGWCFDIFFNELDNLYSEMLKGNEPSGSKESLSFSEYAMWQKDFLQSEIAKKEIEFWVDKLSLPLPVLEFPIDKIRPIEISHEGSSLDFSLNRTQTLKLKEFAKKENISFFNLLLASFKFVLSKFSLDEEIIVGTPVRSRPSSKFNETIGYFVNIVAIRSHIDRNSSFKVLLQQISRNTNEAISKDNVPFEIISNILKIDRDTSRTPVFQSFFSFQDISNRANEFNGEKKQRVILDKASVHTDIDFSVRAAADLTEFLIEYSTDLFEHDTMIRLKECLCFFFENIDTFLDKKFNEIEILPPNQKHTLLVDWNNTSAINEKKPFFELIQNTTKKFPNNIAVKDDSINLTYQELEDKSNSWANKLISMGVKPGDNVGLSTDRNAYMLVSLLAILKTGAGYIPLEPSFPQDRLDYMIESSGLNTILIQDHLMDRFNSSIEMLSIDDLIKSNFQDSSQINVNVSLEDTCYIIYTSGSTGLPKGVELLHGSVTNFLQSMSKKPGMKENDSLLAVTTLSFDIAVLELYLPLLVGGSVFVASKEQTIDGEELNKIIKSNNINTMQATPSTWRLLLASDWRGNKDFKILCGGEPFPKDLAQKLCPISKEVWNMYGPTETTVWSTCHKVSLNDLKMYIGTPIDNTGIYILDEELKPVPIGTTGEMYISGYGLAKGYKGRDDLTNAVFIQSPLLDNLDIYNTGDLARYHFDGKLECLGRNDGQVKVRGYRIELGEIESVISKYQGVLETVVITREDIPGDVRIVAYLRIEGEKLDQIGIRKFISNSLPNYMIPSHFILLDVFPKTLNEKIDKKKLKSNEHRPGQISSVKPKSKIDENLFSNVEDKEKINLKESLRLIWKEILKIDFIDDHTNFYDLGGNSIIMLNIISRIKTDLRYDIKLKTFLNNNTINSLFEYLESCVEEKDKSKSFEEVSSENIKANDNQTKIFYFSKYFGSSNLYNLPSALKCNVSIDENVLSRALMIMIERHEILRTNFFELNDDVFQKTKGSSEVLFDIHKINIDEKKLLDEINQKKKREFDFETDLLFELYLYDLGNENNVLFFMPHHIIWDGQSFDIFFKELNEIYNSIFQRRSPSLKDITLTYKEFVKIQSKYLLSDQAVDDIKFWKSKFHKIPDSINFRNSLERPDQFQSIGRRLDFEIPSLTSNKIKEISKKNNLTTFSFLFGVYNLFISNIIKRNDITIGVPVSGRLDHRLENTLGYFVNSIPILSKIDNTRNNLENIKDISDEFLECFGYQRIPFDLIIRNLNLKRDPSITPLYQLFFTFKETKDVQYSFGEKKSEFYRIDRNSTHTDVDITLISRDSGIIGYFDYRVDLFDSIFMDKFKADWIIFLDTIVNEYSENASNNHIDNTFEFKLKKIWIDLLGYEEINTSSDFFLLGGHSILAFKMFSQIEKEFNIKIMFKEFFAKPTFLTICTLLEKKLQDKNNSNMLSPLKEKIINIHHPISMVAGLNQKTIHFAELLATESTPNNLPIAFRIKKSINLNILKESINFLIQRHESLRTSFDIKDNNLFFTVHPVGKIESTVDSYTINEKSISKTIKERSGLRFDLSKAPLLKCELLKIEEGGHVIFLMFHHIVWDAASFDIIKNDINKIYNALLNNKIPNLSKINKNFRDYLLLENTYLSSDDFLRAEIFWKNHLIGNLPKLEIKKEITRPSQMSFTGKLFQFKINANLKRKLESYSKDNGVSLFNLFLTAFKISLSSLSGIDDIVIGTPVNCRPSQEYDETTGYFVNTIPIRSKIDLSNDFLSILSVVRDNLYDCMQYKMVPFDKILKLTEFERDSSKTPIYQTLFSFVDNTSSIKYFFGDKVEHVTINRNSTHTDIDLWLNKHDDVINGNIQFYDQVYSHENIKSLVDLFQLILTNIVSANPKNLKDILAIQRIPDSESSSSSTNEILNLENPTSSDEYEMSLLLLWRELLQFDEITVKDNFFEIGGHSLLAVQLFTKINDLYKVNIKLAALFQYPTINQLASFIKSELNIKSTDISSVQNHSNNYDSKIFQSLVPIRTSGSDLPIFMFHSVGGNVLNYVKLAIGIDDTHPIYGLQSRGVDGFSAMDNSIEDMASAYILEMKLISPKGPYILCGGSMGGSIAVEVAIQLEAMGDKIQKLIIFDTFGPNIDIKKLKDEGNNFFKNIKTSLYYRSMTIINKIRTTLLKGFGVSIPHSIRYFNIEMNNYKALWKYKPGVYRGDLILFRAPIDSSGWYSDPLMGWKGTIQGHIKTILLEGGHSDFVEIKELPLLLNKEIKD